MNVVASSGWIEYIADDVNANFLEPPIVDSENLLIPTSCLYGVLKRVLQEFGEERALDAMGIMSLRAIIDLDRQIAIHAAQISNELKLAMADSIIRATARAYDATLWIQDDHFKRIEGVK
jgi:predicted nucleic acid-binding protein